MGGGGGGVFSQQIDFTISKVKKTMSLEKVHPHSVRILPKTKSKHHDFFKPLFGKNAQPGTLKKCSTLKKRRKRFCKLCPRNRQSRKSRGKVIIRIVKIYSYLHKLNFFKSFFHKQKMFFKSTSGSRS